MFICPFVFHILSTKYETHRFFYDFLFERTDLVITLGGGFVGDITEYAAIIFL
jgi:3-dehydroquinate synthetase